MRRVPKISKMIFKTISKRGALLMSGSLAAAGLALSTNDRNLVTNIHTDTMILFGGQSHPKFTQSLAARLGVKVSSRTERSSSQNECPVGRSAACSKRPSAIKSTAFRSRRVSMARTSTLYRRGGAGPRCGIIDHI